MFPSICKESKTLARQLIRKSTSSGGALSRPSKSVKITGGRLPILISAEPPLTVTAMPGISVPNVVIMERILLSISSMLKAPSAGSGSRTATAGLTASTREMSKRPESRPGIDG